MSGSLTVVGLGPGRPEHVTLEAAELLREAETNPKAYVYGFIESRDVANAVSPDLEVLVFEELFGGSDEPAGDRPQTFQRIIGLLMRDAFVEGYDVLFLATGNALVINDLVFILRRTCARYKKPLRVVPGLSFLDVILERVFWRAESGLQLHSAWTVTRGDVDLDPQHPSVLYELGEQSAGAEDEAGAEAREMLEALVGRLSAILPTNHPVSILHSSGPPDHESRAVQIPLAELPEQSIPPLSNLWIPPLGGQALDTEIPP